MDMCEYKKDLQGKSTTRFTQSTLCCQMMLISLLSLNVLVFNNHAVAAEYGSLTGGSININGGGKIIADTLDGTVLYGIKNPYGLNNSVIELGDGVSILANATGTDYARSIILNATKSTLIANEMTVSSIGNNADGLYIMGQDTRTDLGHGGSIIVKAKNAAQAIVINKGSWLRADGIRIITDNGSNSSVNAAIDIQGKNTLVDLGTNSIITTNGRGANGIFVFGETSGPAKFKASNLTVVTSGDLATGINLNDNATADLGTSSVISTSGINANGITAYDTALMADALTVNTKGAGSIAVEARSKAKINIGAGSYLSSAQAGALVASGDDVVVNFLGTDSNRNTIFSRGSYGVSSQAAGVVNLTNTDIIIDRNGNTALGLWAMNGSNITGSDVTINGAVGTYGIYTMTNSQVNLADNTIIKMADPAGIAIATQNNDGYAASRINISGMTDIQGSIFSLGGMINIDMSSGSNLTGKIYTDGINDGVMNLTMENSRWNVTADSNLTTLSLNNSVVDFVEDKTGSVLTVEDLKGNGTFIMRTDIVGDGGGVNNTGDRLVVAGTSSGNHLLNVLNSGSLATTGNEVLTVVNTSDGQAKFGLANKVELGGYLYGVRKNANDWELYSSGTNIPVTPEPVSPEVPLTPAAPAAPTDPGSNGGGRITTAADAGANYLNIGYLINYAETQTLLQRMGDLRQNKEHGDIWLRGFSGKFDSHSFGKMSGFNMPYNGVQFGADKRISEVTPLFIGTYIGTTDGDPNYKSGTGSVQSSNMGVYATYMAQDGFYADVIAKYSRLKNKFNVLDSQAHSVSGIGSSDGMSLSLEAGQKFSLNRPGNGFYIEPQAQFSFGHQKKIEIAASNGLNIDLDSYNSTLGRASAIVGYELNTGSTVVNVYVKMGYMHEFEGNVDYHLNGSTEQHTFRGGWWNNGVGVSAQINKQHSLYVDVTSSTSNKFDQQQINGGYRFSF